MKKLIYALTFLLATSITTTVRADEGDDDDDDAVTAADVVLDKNFAPSANVGAVHLLIHKAGHLIGKPYVIEVSEMCPVAGSTASEDRVIDTTSACDVAVNSLQFDAVRSELSVLVRDANEDGVCLPKPKRVVFELSSGCAD